jgi:hypothetical protein
MATKPIKPVTTFSERCDDANARGKWLGIARLSRIPDVGFPVREGCQAVVTPEERLAGQKLINEYREQEQLADQHDADRRQRDLDRLGGNGQHGFERSRLRKEIEQCDLQTFLNAQQRLTELRDAAIELAKPIFERLTAEFDRELNAAALHREEELTKMGVPLFSEKLSPRGEPYRDFALYSDPIVTGWQVRREIVRSTAITLSRNTSVGAIQFLTTAEPNVPFGWLA